MPRHEENAGPVAPAVRRAVTAPRVAGDLEALRPRPTRPVPAAPVAPATSAVPAVQPEETEARREPREPGASGADNGGGEAEVSRVSPRAATVAAAPAPTATAAPAPTATAAPAPATAATPVPAADSALSGRGRTGLGSVAVAGAGGNPPARSGAAQGVGEQPPSGRPSKALLAGAGIAGALMIAVPFLVMGTHDDDREKEVSETASGVTMPKESEHHNPGTYVPEIPVPSPGDGKGSGGPDASGSERGDKGGSREDAVVGDSVPSSDGADKGAGRADTPAADSSAAQQDEDGGTGENGGTGEDGGSGEDGAVVGESVSSSDSDEKKSRSADAPASERNEDGGAGEGAPVQKMSVPEGTEVKKRATPRKLLVAADPSNSKHVMLRNVLTGLCADVPGYGKGQVGGPVNQFDCEKSAGDNQVWDFEVSNKGGGPGGANLFVIKNEKDGLCMDAAGKGDAPGPTAVTEGNCDATNADNQLWWLDGQGDGTYWIRNAKSSDRCLDVWGETFGSGGRDAHLGLADCNPEDDHAWKLD